MLRTSTIQAIFRFTIYLLFALIFVTALNILHDPETTIRTTKESFSALRNVLEKPLRDVWNSEGREYGYRNGYGYGYENPTKEVKENLLMGEKECLETFPGFDKEVREAVGRGPFELKRIEDEFLGPAVQGRISNWSGL